MKVQSANENVLVVSTGSHCFDEVNVGMLSALAAGII
jgi:hypothetical protein